MTKRLTILAAFVVLCSIATSQNVVRDSVEIFFRQGKSTIDAKYRQNGEALGSLRRGVQSDEGNYRYFLKRADVYGTASLEGRTDINNKLSEQRSDALAKHISTELLIPDSIIVRHCVGRDWRKLRVLASLDDNVPSQQEVVNLLDVIAAETEKGKSHDGDPLRRLQSIADGKAYSYLARHHFGKLRAAKLCLTYYRVGKLPQQASTADVTTTPVNRHTIALDTPRSSLSERTTILVDPLATTDMTITEDGRKAFQMTLKTNLLADVALTPNIGAEFHLGRRFTVAASWQYAWWKSDPSKWYWRTYGGEIGFRKYFGKASKANPFSGHHIGIYGQAFTYDFEFGGRGYLCDSWTYAAGIEYGYSLPIHRRLNLDFSIGIGYMNGIYEEYLPKDNCYVWQSTRRLQWFGPTKLEISLVWLIGRGNYNKMGGKKR